MSGLAVVLLCIGKPMLRQSKTCGGDLVLTCDGDLVLTCGGDLVLACGRFLDAIIMVRKQ